MKKYILIIILSLISLSAFAKAPNLYVEQLFNGAYNNNPSVSLNIIKSQDKFFRGCTVTNNKALVEKVTQLFDKDLPQATTTQDIISDGTRYRSIIIKNNGEEIYIGLSYDGNNGCYLFITGILKAFK